MIKMAKHISTKKSYFLSQEGGEAIDVVRANLRLAQRELGAKAGLSQALVSAILLGYRRITLEYAAALYQALEKDPRLKFLESYAKSENKEEWNKYIMYCPSQSTHVTLVRKAIHSALDENRRANRLAVCQDEIRVLRPLYFELIKIYTLQTPSTRQEMVGKLEKLIQEYNTPPTK